ncbi:Ras guanine nucleotide exchange factor bud5, variant 2 [Mucor circinelloides]
MTLSLNQHSIASPSPTSLSPPTSPVVSSPSPSTLTSHFVQALHDYLPSSVTSTDDSVCCLFFKKGSIIEVFNRDDSGWWDGQCGDVRGWFPSNYVGRIGELKRSSADFEDDYSNQELELWHQRLNHHVNNTSTVSLEEYSTKVSTIQTRVEMARALLKEDRRKSSSITTSKSSTSSSQLQILLQDVSKRVAELVDACNQPASSNIQLIIFQVVSAVRSVLTEANIVNKESALLRMYPELARQRKIVLSALSRLVLKGKELQQDADSEQPPPATAEDGHDQASYFADQLLNEMEMFEKLLMVIPRQSSVSDSTVDTTRPSSMFHFDTPRSSVSSLGHSSVISTTSLRHISTSTDPRHTFTQSTASLIAKAVPISDKEHILHNILDHQASIDELMASLVMTLERYLVNRHRATEMLETTRKAVEAVRTFLAVVEHVCSNLGDLDYNRRISMIPEDPCLVTLVITKESVYSAITNLVTAVRVLTGPQKQEQHQQDESIIKEDFDHLCLCCEDVVKTTNECAACVRACLQAEQEEQEEHDKIMYTMQEDTKSDTIAAAAEAAANNLNALGRKISSLHAIQHYHQDQHEQADSCEKLGGEGHSEQNIEGLAIESAPKISTNTENNALKSMCNGHDVRTHAMISNRNSPMPAASTSSSSSSINAATTTTTSSSEADSIPAVDAIVPETVAQRHSKLRPRAASVNNSQFLPLPPLPPKNSIIVKPSISAAAFPLPPAVNTPQQQQQHGASVKGAQPKDQVLKSRRPRGLSVSSLRPSINKSKSERITNTASSLSTSSSMESLLEPLRIQKLPSWMSISSNAVDKHEHHNANSMDIAPSPQLQLPKNEPEHDFLKQHVFTEDEMMFNADGEVTGATIEALVQKLTLHEKSPDLLFTRAFFYNFRLFTNPTDFVQLLKDRFTLKPPTEPVPLPDDQLTLWTNRVLIPIRLRVYNVIKTWLETYFSFEQDASVEQSLVDFASHEMSKAMPGPAKRMLELITRTVSCDNKKAGGRERNLQANQELFSLHQKG